MVSSSVAYKQRLRQFVILKLDVIDYIPIVCFLPIRSTLAAV
jgi:hypothetical protein